MSAHGSGADCSRDYDNGDTQPLEFKGANIETIVVAIAFKVFIQCKQLQRAS